MRTRSADLARRPLWVCPRCGNRFANRNNSHSCVDVPIDEHFHGRPRARELWEAFRAAVETTGPVILVSSKTRLAFMTRVRFLGCEVHKASLRAGFWLDHVIDSPRITKIEFIPPGNFLMWFDIRDEADLDAEVMGWLRLARAVGDQEGLAERRYSNRVTLVTLGADAAVARERVQLLRHDLLRVRVVNDPSAGPTAFEVDGDGPPNAFVIDLDRAPSEALEVAELLGRGRATHAIPTVFAGGSAEVITKARRRFREASFTSWSHVGPATRAAIAKAAVPARRRAR